MVFRTEFIGLFCLCLVYVSVGYADYVVIYWLLLDHFLESVWFVVHLVIFNLLLVILTFSHLRAVFSDPGIIPKPKVSVDFSDRITREQFSRPGWTICTRCDMYRPPRAHHCGTCKRCIRKMDHHCPWVNNCVGECNQKYFLLFLFYTNMAVLYAVVLLIAAWVIEVNRPFNDQKESLVIHSVVLAVECILYFTFTVAIGCDQITAILSQKSQIDRLKEPKPRNNRSARSSTSSGGHDIESPSQEDYDSDIARSRHADANRRRTTRELFEDVFGEEPLWKWFLPLPPSIKLQGREEVEGEFLL